MDYFKGKLIVYKGSTRLDYINQKSHSHIGINVYPFENWTENNQKANLIFDTIEFLFRYISKPGEWGYLSNHTGWNRDDYLSYDEKDGKKEFREEINLLLSAFDNSFELQADGKIVFRQL